MKTHPDLRAEPDRVTVERFYAATPQRLFAAWTDPALVCQWMGPGPMRCSVPLYEPRQGGRFRIEMTGRGPDGQEHTMVNTGTFLEVRPPTRLVMAYDGSGEGDEAMPATRVTLTLEQVQGGTRLRLVHEGLPNREFGEHAGQGWASSFEKLAKLV